MDQQDSFTKGTPATGGAVKVYFDEDNAIAKIKLAKALYFEYVEKDKMKSVMK